MLLDKAHGRRKEGWSMKMLSGMSETIRGKRPGAEKGWGGGESARNRIEKLGGAGVQSKGRRHNDSGRRGVIN